MRTTRSGSEKGRPRRKRSCIKLKIAVFMPIPSVSVSTARKVNPGDLRSWRSANLRSFIPLSLGGDPVFDDLAIKQVNRAVSVLSKALVVGHHANGGPALVQFLEQLHHCFAIARIKIARWLVCQQNGRPARERPGDGHALLLTPGELTWQVFCAMRHPYALQSSGDKRLALTGAHSAISQWQLDILKDSEIPDQIEALKNETNFAIANARPVCKGKIGDFVSL